MSQLLINDYPMNFSSSWFVPEMRPSSTPLSMLGECAGSASYGRSLPRVTQWVA
jgi:hypothetical protein